MTFFCTQIYERTTGCGQLRFTTKRLAEATQERMELQLQHYGETEHTTMALNKSANNLSDTDYALQKPRSGNREPH